MKSQLGFAIILIVAVLAGYWANQPATIRAQAGGSYELMRLTIDAAGLSQGGGYQVDALAGQPDVGSATGQGYELAGAFWPSKLVVSQNPQLTPEIYLPLLIK
jgi:hypothetical protein